MFGLMRFRNGALEGEEQRRRWRMHYCGACKTIGRQYGQSARVLLNHDAVFLAELLTSLGGTEVEAWSKDYRSWNCMRLPAAVDIPPVLAYAAAATILLSEYKLADHAADSKSKLWAWAQRRWSAKFRKARKELARFDFPLAQCDAALNRQTAVEARGAGLDEAAAPTAEATRFVFRHGPHVAGAGERADSLAAVGYAFGRLIYLLDAWEDYERDQRTGAFNGLRSSGLTREWGAARIREEASAIATALRDLGAPPEFRARLQANIAARLSPQFPLVHNCRPAANPGLRQRWRDAMARTKGWHTSPGAFAAVFAMAFLFPLHARMAKSSAECLSLGLNLMALGGLLAAVQVTSTGQKTGRVRSCYNSCCGGCCGDCTADCCCEGCVESCCDTGAGACCECGSCCG